MKVLSCFVALFGAEALAQYQPGQYHPNNQDSNSPRQYNDRNGYEHRDQYPRQNYPYDQRRPYYDQRRPFNNNPQYNNNCPWDANYGYPSWCNPMNDDYPINPQQQPMHPMLALPVIAEKSTSKDADKGKAKPKYYPYNRNSGYYYPRSQQYYPRQYPMSSYPYPMENDYPMGNTYDYPMNRNNYGSPMNRNNYPYPMNRNNYPYPMNRNNYPYPMNRNNYPMNRNDYPMNDDYPMNNDYPMSNDYPNNYPMNNYPNSGGYPMDNDYPMDNGYSGHDNYYPQPYVYVLAAGQSEQKMYPYGPYGMMNGPYNREYMNNCPWDPYYGYPSWCMRNNYPGYYSPMKH